MDLKAFMNWSGGKDSALALYNMQQQGRSVEAMLTSINAATDRISMHGVRRALLQQQASCLRLPLHTIELPETPVMQAYEAAVQSSHQQLKEEGFTHGVFGDIFLEDLKSYRETLLAKDGLQCIFPLWKMKSHELLKQFFKAGFKAIVICVNSQFLDKTFCGRLLDESFIDDLPPDVDPCGENGEYHSFVFDGPVFSQPVQFKKGEIVYKEYAAPKTTGDCFRAPQASAGFYFQDLLPE